MSEKSEPRIMTHSIYSRDIDFIFKSFSIVFKQNPKLNYEARLYSKA